MKVVLDISDSLVGRVKDAIEAGEYDDPQEFVRTAISNQVKLEENKLDEAKTIEEALDAVDTDGGESATQISEDQTQSESVGPERAETGDVPLSLREYDEITTVAPPAEERLDDGPLWGQYNRVFPVKLVVRGLANELADEKEDDLGLELPAFRRRIASAARTIGLEVASHDEQAGRGRGEKLAAGLPTGEDAAKSMDRFQTHFVGRIEHSDELTGAPPHLSFVDLVDGDPQLICLTNAGREFASLHNPLLDDGVGAAQSLSRAERRFYVSHVRANRAAEFRAMQKIAQAVTEGDDRPDSLTERVAYINPQWSNSQARTIRSGLTSRMHELGLLNRRRVGQRGIAYELTTDGEAFRSDGTAFAVDQ